MKNWRAQLALFGKAQVTSMEATVVDFSLTYLLLMLSAHYMVAATVGAVVGGAVNCILNYWWTFSAQGLSYRKVAIRYTMVWAGGVLLRIWGVFVATNYIRDYALLENMPQELRVMLAKWVTAVIVSIFWNYMLQRYYVFKESPKIAEEC